MKKLLTILMLFVFLFSCNSNNSDKLLNGELLMKEEVLKKLHESGSKYFDLPSFEEFKQDMQSEETALKFKQSMSEHYDMPDDSQFLLDIGIDDLIKDFYAKYDPERYSEEQVARVKEFYKGNTDKLIKDFYAKYDPVKFKKLYSYLSSNNLTDLDENEFFNKYSDFNKSKELHSYLIENNLTDLDENEFHSSYFGGEKRNYPLEEPGHIISKINLLKAKTWVLVSEKDPLMGLNKVPADYYLSRKFNNNGKGVESISTDTKKNPPKSSNFTYSLVGNDLTITQDDGYVLNEELREISEDKLVLNIKKFQNERTYKAKDKMNNLTAGQDSNNGWITKKSGKYSISIPKDWLFSESDPGTEFIVTSPLSTKPNDMFAENVNLIVQMVGNMTMDEYMNLTKKQFAGMNVSDLRIVDVKGKKELEYSFKYGGSELKVLQYLWLENRKAYILTYTDMKAAFGMHIKLGRRILNSFKF